MFEIAKSFDGEYYVVESILVMRVRDGKKEFLLRWAELSTTKCSWEPEDHLECPNILKVSSLHNTTDACLPSSSFIGLLRQIEPFHSHKYCTGNE